MSKHDKDEQHTKAGSAHEHHTKAGSAHEHKKPVQPGSPEDKENLKHEHEVTRDEHAHANPTNVDADDRTDGQRQRDEQLKSGGRPYTDQPVVAAQPAVDEQRPTKINTPPDSPLVVPTNNADPPVAATPWNPPQGEALQRQAEENKDLLKQYQDPQKAADDEASKKR